MLGRYVSAVVIAFVMSGLGLTGSGARTQRAPVLLAGMVQITTSPNGLTTAVAVDVIQPNGHVDGIVEQGFRVQHKLPRTIGFKGYAKVTFTETGLLIEPADEVGWAFVVDGFDAGFPSPSMAYPMAVVGISHHWGQNVQRSAGEVTATLLTTGCYQSDQPGEGCENCEGGGPGTTGCQLECDPENSCGARCAGGYFACCNCPSGCGCCPNIIQRPQAGSIGTGASRTQAAAPVTKKR